MAHSFITNRDRLLSDIITGILPIENINTIKTEHTESRLNTDIIDNGYKNEFAGEKLWLRESAIVITQCNHGYIVRELATLLKNRGYEVNNN